MTHLSSDLTDAFPDDAALLHALKVDSAHVRKLVEQYDALNHAVHRIETDVEPGSDEHLEVLNVNRRPIGPPYRRAKGTPFALRGSVDAGRRFRAAGGIGRA